MEEEYSKKRKGAPSRGTWETIYCSLALILVAFFAMLVSYSTIDGARTTNFMRGFGGGSKRGMEGIISYGADGYKTGEGESIVRPSKDVLESNDTQPLPSLSLLKKYLRDVGLSNSVRIEMTSKGFKAIFEDDVLFASGVATISPAMYSCLDRMVQIVKETDLTVRIEGHTDTVPIATTRFPSNWELSTERAVSVLRYFMDRGGLPVKRLTALGFGQYRPVAPNDTEEGRGKNRRVECYFETESLVQGES